jgi:MFS family permease
MPIMRWVILLVLMFGWGASQWQRASLSVLVPVLQAEWGLSASPCGMVFTAFVFGMMGGYVLMTVVTALLGTRWGLAVGFAGAALASVASGFAGGYVTLLASRFMLGFFSAAFIPAAVQTVREWFP